jgi:hypothetical protein
MLGLMARSLPTCPCLESPKRALIIDKINGGKDKFKPFRQLAFKLAFGKLAFRQQDGTLPRNEIKDFSSASCLWLFNVSVLFELDSVWDFGMRGFCVTVLLDLR